MLEDADPAMYKFVLDVNIAGVMHTVKCSTKLMAKSGGGQMALCSSIYGLQATPMLSAYITSKHAVEGLKKAMALGAKMMNFVFKTRKLCIKITHKRENCVSKTRNFVLNMMIFAELLPHNIRVNNLNPSWTPSEMTGPFSQGPFRDKCINAMQTDGRMSEMGETSAAVAYLLSPDSRYINGSDLY